MQPVGKIETGRAEPRYLSVLGSLAELPPPAKRWVEESRRAAASQQPAPPATGADEYNGVSSRRASAPLLTPVDPGRNAAPPLWVRHAGRSWPPAAAGRCC